ncbi:hypothetical protein K6U06_17630 [Acidiferrimicrobium sp. IK]|uniref:hypothetical protein n=1 Tax=Acidiferrimicrobium sp. IK TaxID=2871700 RepID=UPI0021CB1596|nr:hypothetical protein [Acidiferrimicrobium sp. IK]MCU4186191.1 hypothetical protein [Acidiferrimicrobium sp. IK]
MTVIHPMLQGAFASLDTYAVDWCLLRGEATLADPHGDVDLLVAHRDHAALDDALASQSFLRLQRWGAGGHLLYLGYHPATDRWIELDIESDIEFGQSGSFLTNWTRPALRLPVGVGVLGRRQLRDGIWVPDPDDEFWLLLLHCVIDKASVAERHRARLGALAGSASGDGPIGRAVTASSAPGWGACRMIQAVEEGRWDELVAAGQALSRRATAAMPVRARAAALGRGIRRLAANAQRVGQGRGATVALLGPDGAGKSTLAEGLASAMPIPCRLVYMGLWQGEGDAHEPVSLGKAVIAAALRPLKAWRRAATALYHQARGRTVIHDRHSYDALLPPRGPHARLKRVFFGFLARSVPPPSLVLVLDVPSDVAHGRRPDENAEHLALARRQYQELARRLPQAATIAAERSQDEMRVEALSRFWEMMVASRRPVGSRRHGPGGLLESERNGSEQRGSLTQPGQRPR